MQIPTFVLFSFIYIVSINVGFFYTFILPAKYIRIFLSFQIAAIEGQNAIKHKVKLELSEQELIDCSDEYGNDGCFGGWMNYAFSYIQDNGISTEKEYSYQEENLKCRKYINKSAVIVTGYKDINNNEEDLKKAVGMFSFIAL